MIKVVPDVGAPLAVAAVNIATRTAFPVQHDWFVYGMTLAGYIAGFMDWGGDFIKNVGVSSLPLSADKLYDRFSGGTAVSKRLAMSKVSNSVGSGIRQRVSRSYEPEFNTVGVI